MQQQSRVVKAASPDEFLGLVPLLLGAPPRNSLVLVVFTGNRTHSAIRLNLPTGATPAAIKRLATTFIGMVCKVEGADGVIPVVYTDEPFGTDGVPHAELLGVLRDRARRAGLRVTGALCVAANGYGSIFDPDLPPGGRPLSEIVPAEVAGPPPFDFAEASTLPTVDAEQAAAFRRVAAAMNGGDPPALRARRALLRLIGPGRSPDVPAPHPSAVEAAIAALARADGDVDRHMVGDDEIDSANVDVDSDAPIALMERFFDAIDDLLFCDDGPRRLNAQSLVAIAADLPSMRDVVLLTIGWGTDFGHYAFERGVLRRNEPLAEHDAMAMAFSGGDMARPLADRVERGISALREAAAMTDEADRAPLLTMTAWLHWTLGRGTVAGRFADQARRIDPAYGLAELLDRMLGAGMLPEWAYRSTPLSDEGRAWLRMRDPEAAA